MTVTERQVIVTALALTLQVVEDWRPYAANGPGGPPAAYAEAGLQRLLHMA